MVAKPVRGLMFIMCFLENNFLTFYTLSFWKLIIRAGLENFKCEGKESSFLSITLTSSSVIILLYVLILFVLRIEF